MRTLKIGKLLAGAVVILLSVLVLTQIGSFCHAQTTAGDSDCYQEGLKLFANQEYEKAFGKFNAASIRALTLESNQRKAMYALKYMAQCTYIVGAIDTCKYYYKKAASIAHELNMPYEEFDIYSGMRQAYLMKVDMQNVLLMTEKIDSLISNSTDTRLKLTLYEKLAQESMMQQNDDLTEYYLLEREALLAKLSYQDRISFQFVVYGALREFYTVRQDFEKALKYSRLYIENSKTAFQNQPMAFMGYGSESIIYSVQKNRQAAFAALDSMKLGTVLNPATNVALQVQYYEIEGTIHTTFEEWEEACTSFKKAIKIAEGTPLQYRPVYFRNQGFLGNALYHTKKYDEARSCYSQYAMYCKNQSGENSLAYSDALWALATFEGLCGENIVGKEYYIKSVDISKKLVKEQLRFVSIQERNTFWANFAPKMWGMVAYALRTKDSNSYFTEKCYESLLFSKALLLESDRSMVSAINTECSQEEQRIYYQMVGLQNQLKALMNNYEKNKNRVDSLHKQISTQNIRLTPIISKLGFTSFLSLNYNDIKQSLGDDEILLDFTDFVTEDKAYQHAAFVIAPTQQYPQLIKVFTEDKIKQLLNGKPTDFLYKEPYASQALSLIWNPLKKEIHGKKTIYYVPSGILHKIALESIPMDDGTLLGDHYRFVRITSAREITRLKHDKQTALNFSATLYGALKYDVDATMMASEASRYHVEPLFALNRGEAVRGNGPFRDLPNTKEEIDKIEKILKEGKVKVTPRTGAAGTEESFLALSGKAPNILHVATHGFYYTADKAKEVNFLKGYNDAMMLSGLIMSGGNLAWTGRQVPQGVLGGVLTANNIAGMDLRGTDLLVLSACQTGLGIATPEGLFGLQRAFKKAGVQTMVMSLWSVNDEAAKDFMIKFYEELTDSRNKWDKRKAFDKAKVYVRNNPRYKKDPYYWAAFVMLD